jgi:hypothetical protein
MLITQEQNKHSQNIKAEMEFCEYTESKAEAK